MVQEWNREPRQSIGRCVSHLIGYFVSMVEGSTSRSLFGSKDRQISHEEAASFLSRRQRGLGIRRESSVTDVDLIKVMHKVKSKLLNALRKVEVFSKLDEPQLTALRDAMVEAPFEEGEWIFEQAITHKSQSSLTISPLADSQPHPHLPT